MRGDRNFLQGVRAQGGLQIGVLALALWFGGAIPSLAESVTTTTAPQAHALQSEFSFSPPPSNGQPQSARAGGKRDQLCKTETVNPSLTLLLPPTNQGQTVAAHPTFLVYLPPTPATKVFWKLEDKNNNYHYHAISAIPQGAGIVSLKLPETAPELKVDQEFKISLAIICGADLDPSDPVVEGWIKRVEPSAPLMAADQDMSLEQVASYAQNGVWFDAVTTLAELMRSHPNNPKITTAWNDLLASVQLDTIQAATLLDQTEAQPEP